MTIAQELRGEIEELPPNSIIESMPSGLTRYAYLTGAARSIFLSQAFDQADAWLAAYDYAFAPSPSAAASTNAACATASGEQRGGAAPLPAPRAASSPAVPDHGTASPPACGVATMDRGPGGGGFAEATLGLQHKTVAMMELALRHQRNGLIALSMGAAERGNELAHSQYSRQIADVDAALTDLLEARRETA